jgi:hypothetical protein
VHPYLVGVISPSKKKEHFEIKTKLILPWSFSSEWLMVWITHQNLTWHHRVWLSVVNGTVEVWLRIVNDTTKFSLNGLGVIVPKWSWLTEAQCHVNYKMKWEKTCHWRHLPFLLEVKYSLLDKSLANRDKSRKFFASRSLTCISPKANNRKVENTVVFWINFYLFSSGNI